jgi:hypothetical protein
MEKEMRGREGQGGLEEGGRVGGRKGEREGELNLAQWHP